MLKLVAILLLATVTVCKVWEKGIVIHMVFTAAISIDSAPYGIHGIHLF